MYDVFNVSGTNISTFCSRSWSPGSSVFGNFHASAVNSPSGNQETQVLVRLLQPPLQIPLVFVVHKYQIKKEYTLVPCIYLKE